MVWVAGSDQTMTTIEHWDTEEEMILDLRERGFSPHHYTYQPGTSFPPHTHEMDKMATVLSGRFRLTMGDGSVVLEKGDGAFVPSGAVHSAEVVGNDPVVSLDAPRG
jgi:quercetin dioxygenase-like cupin family protein